MTVTNYKIYAIKPKLATNLITNPSVETNTTGYTAVGGTIVASTTRARRGVKSLKVTPTVGTSDGVYYTLGTLTSGVTYTFSLDIWGVSGIPYKFYFANTSGTLLGTATTLSGLGQWGKRLSVTYTAASTATHRLYIVKNNSASTGDFYIDGLQLEADSIATTYIDGDQSGNIVSENVLDYYWSSAVHASTSIRTANTRSGGELVDLETYCKIILTDGLGLPSVDNVSVPMTNGSKQYLYSNHKSEYFSIQVSFKGNELGDIMSSRNGFANLIKPNVTAYNEPLVLRYQGYDDDGVAASDPVNIKCNYVSGLDKSPLRRFVHFADITFELYEPTIQVDGEEAAELDFNDTLANADYIVKRDRDGVWSAMAGLSSCRVIRQHPITKEIYVGDDATVKKWSGTAWVDVVVAGSISDMAFDAVGNLYIVGNFTGIGDANGNYVLMWNGTALVSLGTGLNGIGQCVTVSPSGMVIVGGSFTLAGGVANTVRIAYWDGSVWNPYSTGIGSGGVYDIAIDKNGYLVIVGSFTNHIDGSGDYITLWDNTSFSSLGSGLNALGRVAFVDDANNYLVGGAFTTAGGITVNYWAKWNGNKWEALGDGVEDDVLSIASDNLKTYIAGLFTYAGSVAISDKIAIYLGNGIYQPLDINLPGAAQAHSLFFDHQDNLYIGYATSGNAETAGDTDVTNSGKAKTYPIIEVTGTGLLRQIVNTTTGRGIYFNDLTLLSGEVITIDLRPDNITMVSSFRGSVKGYVLKGSNLDFPLIPGTNRIATFIDGTTDSNTKAVMKWTKHLHGVDGALYE